MSDDIESTLARLEELTTEGEPKQRLFGHEVVAGLLPYVRDGIAARKRIAELEAFAKCPIGLDETPDICSAGTCRGCLSELREALAAARQWIAELEEKNDCIFNNWIDTREQLLHERQRREGG